MSKNRNPEAITVGIRLCDVLDLFLGKPWKLMDGNGKPLRANDFKDNRTGMDGWINPILRFATEQEAIVEGVSIARRWKRANQAVTYSATRKELTTDESTGQRTAAAY